MLTLAVYLHRLDPFAIRFPQGFPVEGIRWYGLSYLLGFVIAYLLLRRVAAVGRSSIKPQMVGDLVVTMAVGLVVGGRLGYALFYQRELFISFSADFPWWDLLALNKGGMASHGGMIGGIIAAFYYGRRYGHSWPFVLDLACFGAPLGLFFGRIANFINGELIGRATTASNPLAVQFPQELDRLPPSVLNPVILRAEKLGVLMPYGSADPVAALMDLVKRGNADVIALVQPILPLRHPSQLYEAVLEGLVLFIVVAIVWCRPRKPGMIAGVFAATYGLLRIAGERFREPDAHIGYDWLGLTRGQWLSVSLTLVGLVLLWAMSRRNVEPMGGWCKVSR